MSIFLIHIQFLHTFQVRVEFVRRQKTFIELRECKRQQEKIGTELKWRIFEASSVWSSLSGIHTKCSSHKMDAVLSNSTDICISTRLPWGYRIINVYNLLAKREYVPFIIEKVDCFLYLLYPQLILLLLVWYTKQLIYSFKLHFKMLPENWLGNKRALKKKRLFERMFYVILKYKW